MYSLIDEVALFITPQELVMELPQSYFLDLFFFSITFLFIISTYFPTLYVFLAISTQPRGNNTFRVEKNLRNSVCVCVRRKKGGVQEHSILKMRIPVLFK